MTRGEFEAAFKKLVAAAGRGTGNVSCLACERCERCSESTFCVASKGLTRCHYCDACVDCTDASHCVSCTSCLSCQHCTDCERCIGSAYLVRSIACTGCTYCFGCVGLGKKDFHILNEPTDRKTYFETVAKLERELGIRARAGA
jgi:hypothetical protein